MFDFGRCLGVSQKFYPYVCYCKKEKDFSFFQKPGKLAQTLDYDMPKKIIRKYLFLQNGTFQTILKGFHSVFP